MASLPTAADSDAKITAFYRDHGAIVITQQVIGAIALAPFTAFALSLRSGRWLRPAVFLFVAAELVTNIVPPVILESPKAARPLTVVEDLADGALFVATAIFVIVATLEEPLWLRVIAYLIAAVCAIRAVASPLGVTALDQVAPLAFVVFVLVLSVRLLVGRGAPIMTRT
ncbi:MAG TPA: hypothetical protein VJP81_07565 [Candidatus Dormibacteraeota bacterium]|nr:hypothetical protein [Candidatus Dormibacteraeota bacterium]